MLSDNDLPLSGQDTDSNVPLANGYDEKMKQKRVEIESNTSFYVNSGPQIGI